MPIIFERSKDDLSKLNFGTTFSEANIFNSSSTCGSLKSTCFGDEALPITSGGEQREKSFLSNNSPSHSHILTFVSEQKANILLLGSSIIETTETELALIFLTGFRDNESNIVNISDDFSNSIKHLSKAFNIHTELNRIMVYDNSVTFCTYGNDYAISYSTDNITPKYMSSSKDSFQIKTKKICDNWYHIIRIYNKF